MRNKRRVLLPAAFLLPLALLLVMAVFLGLAPFGTKSLACADAYTQYSSYYAFYQDLFRGGKDWLYSFEKILGGSTAGLFAYYLASPFNLLLLLFPGEKLPLAINCLIFLKLSCCGLTMALYFDSRGRLRTSALLFTTAYALCGYNLAYGWCSMWLDAVLMLPLIVWGIDRLIAEGQPLLYLFSLGIAILACFYTGYMLCLFSVLYFVYRLAVEKPGKALLWKRFVRFALASLGAGALSALVLLPGVLALGGGVEIAPLDFIRQHSYPAALYVLQHLLPGRDAAFYDAHVLHALAALALLALLLTAALLWSLFSAHGARPLRLLTGLLVAALFFFWYFTLERHVQRYEMDLRANLLATKLFFGVSKYWEMYNGSPNVYVGQLSLLLALGSFFNRAIPARERKCNLLLLALLLFSLLFYLPNLVWHGFEQNNCFNFRYSFVVCFFLLVLAERSFSAREGITPPAVLLPTLLLLLCQAATWHIRPYYIEPQLYPPMLLWLLLSALVLLLPRRRWVSALLTAAQLSALCFTTFLSLQVESGYGLNTERFEALYTEGRAQFQALAERDRDFYRVRKEQTLLNQNDPMLFDYRGVVHFSSAEKMRTIRFMQAIGIHVLEEYWANGDDGASRAADLLLGVRYFRGESFADYTPQGDGFCRNPYSLPLACAVPQEALAALELDGNPCENLNRLFAALSPGTEAVFRPLSDAGPWEEYGGALTLHFTVESGEPLYLCLWDTHIDRLFLNGTEREGLYAPSAMYLGCFEPGTELELRIQSDKAIQAPDGFPLYHESSEALAALRDTLGNSPCETALLSESHICCDAEIRGEDRALLFDLPLEEGWSVRVDGKTAAAQEALGLFLAVPLEPGVHHVELRFVPPGLIPGAILSASALLLTLLWALLRRRKRA